MKIFLVLSYVLRLLLAASANNRSADSISIAFILEEYQHELPNQISKIFKEIELEQNNYIFKDYYITYQRENLKETMDQFCRIIFNQISILIDLSYSKFFEGFEILKNFQIPYIHVDVSIMPFIRALENYIKARSGHDIGLIFENDKNFEEAIYYMVVEGSELRIGLFKGMELNFENQIKNMRPTPSYLGIFANTENMNTILNKITQTQLKKRPDILNLVFLDTNYENYYHENLSVGVTQLYADKNDACKFLKSENNCMVPATFTFSIATLDVIIRNIKETLDMLNLQPKSYDCSNFDQIVSNSSTINILDLSYIFADNPILNVDNTKISYNLNMTIALKVTESNSVPIAVWNNGQFKNLTTDIQPAKRFFRIGTTESIPWTFIHRDPITHETILDSEGNPIWDGYCIDLIKKLSEKMNFEYEIVSPKHGKFGKRLRDGNWDGLIGDLVIGNTDIAIAALKMTAEREEVIDYIAPYFEQTGISIVIRKPVRQTSLFKFMTVLRVEVWLSIIAAIVGTAIMLWLLDKYSPYSAINNKNAFPYPTREFTLKESFWFALTSFTPQGGGEAPKAISGRVLVAAYWLFVVLMLATFTANLAAFLTVERMQTPVQSLEQLARQSRINYTVVENSDTHEYFINMKFAEDTLYRMWKELTLNATTDQRKYRIWDYPIKEQYGHILLAINSSNPVKDAANGFRNVIEHVNADYAFIHDAAEIKYEISKNCNLTEVGEVFAEQPYAMAVQQGSHIHDELSYTLLELQKDRYFEELTAKYWNHSNKECSDSDNNEGITLESLGGVFIATLFGLLLAMITLAGEVFYYRRKGKQNKQVMPINVNYSPSTSINETKTKTSTYKKSPPPSFDYAIRNVDKKPLDKVILGSDEKFKPTRLRHTGGSIAFIPVLPRNSIRTEEHPPYYE